MTKRLIFLMIVIIITLPVSAQVFYLESNLPSVLQADAGSDNFIEPGDSVMIGGDPAALSGYGNYTYFWEPFTGLSDPTAANPWAKPGETTTYTLTVCDGHHCLAMDEATVKVGASGLDEQFNELQISVYPNPADDYVNILINGHTGRVILKILNNLGQVIAGEEAVQQEEALFNFDTRGWVKGIYHLIIQTREKVETRAIVII